MSVAKQIPTLIAQVFFCAVCFAQREKIDSLHKVLRTLKDTSKVDCFNNLSYAYIQIEKKDSAEYFANLAYSEAKKINYIHGIAAAYIRQARLVKHFNDNFIQSEHLAKQSLHWYEKTANKEGLYDVYYELLYSVVAQSHFSEGEEYANKMYELSKEKSDEAGMCLALKTMTAIYKTAGNYEKSFDYCLRFRQFAEKTNNRFQQCNSLFSLGQLYMKIEDYSSALKCFREAFQMDTPEFETRRRQEDWDIWFKMEFAEVFSHLNQFDSAWHYYKLFRPGKGKEIYLRIWWVSTGECYYLQKDYRRALQNFQLGLAGHQKLNDRNEVMRTLLDMGKTYLALNDNAKALKYGRDGLDVALQTKAKQNIRDGYQILSTAFDRLHQADSANFYFRKYTTMKDEVLNDQAKAKFAVFGYEQKIALLDKEKQLQEQRLRQTNQQKKFLITGIAALCVIGIILFRNLILKRKNEKLRLEHELELKQLESEKTKVEFQHQSSELEMQALRAQMNPHFIFNSLNSINRFILQNNKAQASEYLTKFSRLIRMILQNSQAPLISLENELETLKLYLDLEALRFEDRFKYKISVEKDLETDILKVPPLIIQPYVENAIWHGLMHKEKKGQLDIDISQEADHLIFKVTDDGIGRKQAAILESKSANRHKSMGLKITVDRIAMLHKLNGNESPVMINDLVNPDGSAAGTEVIIKIPVIFLVNNMSVNSQILFLILLFFWGATCFAQRERIDSLKKILPSLHDTARVDCLNELGEAFMLQDGDGYIPFNLKVIKKDSARLYAQQAIGEAKKINYTKGESKAYITLGRIEASLYDDYAATDHYFTRALELTLQINDENQLARSYGYLGWVKWVEGRFAEAMGYYNKAAHLFEKIKDTVCLSETYSLMSSTEQESGNYANALKYALKYQDLSGKEPYALLRRLYQSIGDYETALHYTQNDPEKSKDKVADMEIGDIFCLMKQYDSSMYYFRLSAKNSAGVPETYFGKLYSRWGALYTALKQYDTALVYLENALKIQRKANDGNEIMRVLLELSRTYRKKRNTKIAIQYAEELLQFASRAGGRQYTRDGHLILFEIYDRLKIQDSAYYHLRRYTTIKDSIDLELSAQKLAFYKTKSEREQAQSRINTLNDEKKMQLQKLKQTSLQKKFLIAGIIALLLIGVVLFRNILLKRKNEKLRLEHELELQQLESEKTKVEFQHQASELEMQALRAQMNPHFIFNSLNSINRFILQYNKAQASEYLTKFSKLVRMILQNSQASLITLEAELEALKLYLDLEALRFEHHFEYKIHVEKDLNIDVLKVPPLIIQPFVENAIWHGLMHKEEKGHLDIEIAQDDNHLLLKITDDGIGRKQAALIRVKSAIRHKSMGLKITGNRIAMLQRLNGDESPVMINDLVNPDGSAGGTEVIIKIPLIYD